MASGNKTDSINNGQREFSLVVGGPLFQILRRARLCNDAMTLLHWRVIVLTSICWVPPLLLAAIQGDLLGGKVAVPFLLDFELHIRFLIALPMLLFAEVVVHRRMRQIVSGFLARHLISDRQMPRFDAALESALRLRNSLLAEVILVAFVYIVGIAIIWRQHTALDVPTWYANLVSTGWESSPAGLWFAFVSLPIFQFLLIRWYFRILVWAQFLWRISRFELSLMPAHPDRSGGLGFLSGTVYAFLPLLFAHGTMLAGLIAGRIFHGGAVLTDFKLEVAALTIFLVCLVEGPLLLFTVPLEQAKRRGGREYGNLAGRYIRVFDAKWLEGNAPADASLIGSADIQSLADLGNSLQIVSSMRITLISKESLFILVGAVIAPIVPLFVTIVPMEEIFKKLLGVLF